MITRLFLILILVTSACGGDDAPSDGPMIRIENATADTMSSLRVMLGDCDLTFTDLQAGGRTDYSTCPGAFRYGFVDARTPGERYVIQPFDFVGETPLLASGVYTYVLSIEANGATLEFEGETVSAALRGVMHRDN